MNIIDLYKKHINPNPDGLEVHEFLTAFDIGSIYVTHYDERLEKIQKEQNVIKHNRAENWILDNSKLIKNYGNYSD